MRVNTFIKVLCVKQIFSFIDLYKLANNCMERNEKYIATTLTCHNSIQSVKFCWLMFTMFCAESCVYSFMFANSGSRWIRTT